LLYDPQAASRRYGRWLVFEAQQAERTNRPQRRAGGIARKAQTPPFRESRVE
jgi:hypothetical protein